MENKKIEIEIDIEHLHSINALFSSFMNENSEVLKNSYLDFLNDNNKNVRESDASFPMFCFTVFLFELEKEMDKNERGTL